MDICGHLISTDQIIGIGPLTVQPTEKEKLYAEHSAVHLVFEVHTKARSIEIRSRLLHRVKIGKGNDREMYKVFEKEYYVVRKQIAILLDEDILEQNRFNNILKKL